MFELFEVLVSGIYFCLSIFSVCFKTICKTIGQIFAVRPRATTPIGQSQLSHRLHLGGILIIVRGSSPSLLA